MRLVFLDFLAAVGATEGVAVGINPADAKLGFDIPVARQNPRITVGNAQTGHPTLLAVVGKSREISAEKLDVVFQVAEVILAANTMKTKEMATETLTKPVADFWLNHPLLPAVLLNGPVVDSSRQVDGPLRCHTGLYAQSGAEQGIVK